MQTFFPHESIYQSAQALDSKRLNKQILEAYQILKVLSGASLTGAWRNHPAVLMWKGYEYSLFKYAMIMIQEAQNRGIKTDKNESNIKDLLNQYGNSWGKKNPLWLSDQNKIMRIITTHKARLFDKDPIYYAKFGYAKYSLYNKPCCDTCQYYWVTHEERKVNV